MINWFSKARRGSNENNAAAPAAAQLQVNTGNQAAQVTTGIGGVGQLRSVGAQQRLPVEIPQERSVPGLPSPTGASLGQVGRWREMGIPDGYRVEQPGVKPLRPQQQELSLKDAGYQESVNPQGAARPGQALGQVEASIARTNPMLFPGAPAMTQRTTPLGVTLDGVSVLRPASRLADYQLKQAQQIPRAKTVQGRWVDEGVEMGDENTSSRWEELEPLPRQEETRRGRMSSAQLGDLAMRQSSPEIQRELLRTDSPQDRSYDAPLVSPGQGRAEGKTYLAKDFDTLAERLKRSTGDAGSQDIRGSLDSGDPSDATGDYRTGRKAGYSLGNRDIYWQEGRVQNLDGEKRFVGGHEPKLWTNSNKGNLQTTLEMPFADSQGNLELRRFNPAEVVETVDANTDSTFSPETFREVTLGDKIRELSEGEYRTKVLPRDRVLDLIAAGRGRRITQSEADGTLVAKLFAEKDGQQIEIPVYDPGLANPDDTLYATRQVPDRLDLVDIGKDTVKDESQKLLRIGEPTNVDYAGVRAAMKEQGLVPRVSEPFPKPSKRIYANNLRELGNSGFPIHFNDPDQGVRPASSWQELVLPTAARGLEIPSGYAQVTRNGPMHPVFTNQTPNGQIELFIGDPVSPGTRELAVLSDDYLTRIKAEAGKVDNKRPWEEDKADHSRIYRDMIGSGSSQSRSPGFGALNEQIRGVFMRNDRLRKKGDPAAMGDSELAAAILATAKDEAGHRDLAQAIVGARGRATSPDRAGFGRDVDIFDESDIDRKTAAIERRTAEAVGGDIALWSNGAEEGVNPNAANEYQRIAQAAVEQGRSDETLQYLVDRVFQDGGAVIPTPGVYGRLARPSDLTGQAYEYSRLLNGATGQNRSPEALKQADDLAKLAIELSRGDVEGRAPSAATVMQNIETIAGLDPVHVQYALDLANDGDFARAAAAIDVARRTAGTPVGVLNELEAITGNQVGQAATGGRRRAADNIVSRYMPQVAAGLDDVPIGADPRDFSPYELEQAANIRARYRAPGPDMREFDYPAYAEVLSNPENPHFEKAMAFAAERIRRLREAAAQG